MSFLLAHTKMLTLSFYRVHRCHEFSTMTFPASTGSCRHRRKGEEHREESHTGSSPAGRALPETPGDPLFISMSRTVLYDQSSYKGSQGACKQNTSCKKGTAMAVR